MRASFVIALIPCAILAACSNADQSASDVATYDPNREDNTGQPAASRDYPASDQAIPATPSDAVRDGMPVPETSGTTGTTGDLPGAGPTTTDRETDIIDGTRSDTGTDRSGAGTGADTGTGTDTDRRP